MFEFTMSCYAYYINSLATCTCTIECHVLNLTDDCHNKNILPCGPKYYIIAG